MTAPAGQRSQERTCQSRLRIHHLAITHPQPSRLASGPVTAPQSGVGEEAATPGQPVRARARFWIPSAIHPRESPVAAGSAAIIQQAQELSRFGASTLRQMVAPRNTKK
jgi:hypothetical protein